MKHLIRFASRINSDLFWSHVDRSGGLNSCWVWMACRDSCGYGMFGVARKTIKTHVIAFFLTYGFTKLCVLHNCPGGDNPACCNPRHLWKGTQKQNCMDREAKGRGNHAYGERHGKAKLNTVQVRVIRSLYAKGGISQEILARRYGVLQITVSNIIRRNIWRHVQ